MKNDCSKCTCVENTPSKKECRMYIDYPKEGNCCLNSIEKNGEMTLREVALRLKLSPSAILMIEEKALKKIAENFAYDDIE
jgi:hypothetical protein